MTRPETERTAEERWQFVHGGVEYSAARYWNEGCGWSYWYAEELDPYEGWTDYSWHDPTWIETEKVPPDDTPEAVLDGIWRLLTRRECPACGGSGGGPPYDGMGTDAPDCWQCSGTGYVSEEDDDEAD